MSEDRLAQLIEKRDGPRLSDEASRLGQKPRLAQTRRTVGAGGTGHLRRSTSRKRSATTRSRNAERAAEFRSRRGSFSAVRLMSNSHQLEVRRRATVRGEVRHLPLVPNESRTFREVTMVRCPACASVQFGYLVSPRRAACYYCHATWLQDGTEQTAVTVQTGEAAENSPAVSSQ